MALFVMIIRKMLQNKWLVFSLFVGVLISVALVSSMPIYSEASLSRMLTKDLERLQLDTGVYPGSHYSYMVFSKETHDKIAAGFERVDKTVKETATVDFQLPVQELVTDMMSASMRMKRADDPEPLTVKNTQWVSLKAYTDLEEHIKLIDGRMPASDPVDGVYEALLTPRGLSQFKAVLGMEFVVEDERLAGPIKLKAVGVLAKKEDDDPYFRVGNLLDMNNSFIIPYDLAQRHILQEARIPMGGAGWFLALDYTKMELRNVQPYIDTTALLKTSLLRVVPMFQMGSDAKALSTISNYLERAEQLRLLMWALNVPILIMLAFYMFMVSNLIASRQKNEIAVIRSRGAARWQIIAAYLVEGILLCALAYAAGPLLGAILTEVLGASNGFLEFVQRVRLPVRITEEAYQYGSIAAGACLLIIMIPIMLAMRVSIVNHKQQMARLTKAPLWHKLFLDVITLGLAIYGWFKFRERLNDLQALGLNSADLTIDPMQFVVPALFIMGLGLLLLRLYPWVLRLVYWIGKKWWPPSVYGTLIQVGRSSSQYQFLMIFLIMTIATGIFSASAARTINQNGEDRIQYANGADMVLSSNWINDAPPVRPGGPPDGSEQGSGATATPSRVNYMEPAFEPFSQLPGVEHAARVFTKENASFTVGGAQDSGYAKLMAIDTDEFGMATWFRDSLLEYPLHEYLNLIAPDPKAVLVSKSLAEQKNAKPGDTIWLGWDGVSQQPFRIYGVIDYFPTFNPNPAAGSVDTGASRGNRSPMLIVAHLPNVQFQLALEPYEVWLKLEDGATTAGVYEGIAEAELPVTRIVNTRDELVRSKNDPFQLALNGVLTLGFVLSIMVSFIGFLLYWVLSLRGRTLQNGILRAIGMSLGNLIAMLAVEQALTSGVAVLLGIVVGNAASLLFVPNFQIAFNPSTLVPPFIVKFEQMDALRIYVLIGIMLTVGLCILGYMLSRLRIHQALKLGED